MLLFGERLRRFVAILNIAFSAAGLGVALEITRWTASGPSPHALGVYLASNWEAPFGIVLVADRLSALMLVLVGLVSLGSALYGAARWSRAGVYFHPLFQIQLMGLNGAFLTGDLFNLFVFFEVMLAASYGLQLHGSGWPRVRAGLHYIVVNLLASSLFLVGLAVLYGVTGTLSMADIAAKIAVVPDVDHGLLHAGAAILAVAFLAKAAIWPLSSWLVPAYSSATPPVAALLTLMTKVGIYVLLRLSTLIFSADAGVSARFGAPLLLYAGMATIVFGTVGLMASLRLGRIAGFSIIVSSGTLLSAIGFGDAALASAALFYLVSATLAASALFLLVELVERRAGEAAPAAAGDEGAPMDEDTNLDDEAAPLVGRAVPVSLALLGFAFIACVLVVAGLPPLSGFVAKLGLLTALTKIDRAPAWALFGLLLSSGLVATITLSRAGIHHFWAGLARPPARLEIVEAAPVVGLLLVCALLTARAEDVMRYTTAAADALHAPKAYIDAVLAAEPVPGPTRPAERAP
jgi:multicomponent K+:H+ antiporter subunit D